MLGTDILKPDSKSVAIIILNWNGYEVTRQCLKCYYKLNLGHQIILVDNGSNDESGKNLAHEFPQLEFVPLANNLGFAGGNNIALRRVIDQGYSFVLLLNNDTSFHEDFITPLTDYMISHPKVGAIQPKIFYHFKPDIIWNAGTIYHSFIGMPKTIGENSVDEGAFDQLKQVDWLTGCAMLIRTSILSSVGLLDERFFAYYEDVDLSIRIRRAGHQLVFFPYVKIYHIAGQSLRLNKPNSEGYLQPIFHFYNLRNQLYVMRKHLLWFHKPTAFTFVIFRDLAIVLYFIFRFRFQKSHMAWKGLIQGLISPI